MLERRTMLAGLAALPAVGLPVAAHAASRRDPFAAYLAEADTLQAAIRAAWTDEESDPAMARLDAIDEAVMQLRPTTLSEAASALAFARREHVQYALDGDPERNGDAGDRLVLHLLDGAIAVLRRAAGRAT